MGVLVDFLNYVIDYALIPGGWTLFFAALVWMLYFLRKQKNNKAYVDSIKWVFLEVKIDEINEKSPLAMEQVFVARSEEHTSELQPPDHLVSPLLLEKKNKHTHPS